MLILNGIILILMLLMIAMFFVNKFNQPWMMDDWNLQKVLKWSSIKTPSWQAWTWSSSMEEGPGLAISGWVDQRQRDHHRGGTTTEDDQAKSLKDGQLKNNERSKPLQRPKAIFDILLTKYKEGRVSIRERKN
jgi:hypothetical protein